MGTPRLIGRVVDPLARDDGADEPKVELEPAASSDPAAPDVLQRVSDASAEPRRASNPDVARSGHPVRDRLLARAEEARRSRRFEYADQEVSETSASPAPRSARPFQEELERVALKRPPVAPHAFGRRARLSANMVALFGALFGLATVGALFAVLVHLDPRDGRMPVAAVEAPAPEASAAAPSEPAPPPVPKRERKKIPGPWRVADSTDPALEKISGEIGREPFLRAIQDAGLEKSQAYRVLTALKGLRNLDKCAHTDRFEALVERSTSRVKAFEYIVSKEQVYQAREGDDGLLKGAPLDLKVERQRVQGAVVMTGDSFSKAALAGGFEEGLAAALDEALDGHASVGDFRRGDRIRVVAQEVTVLGEFSRYAGIEAVEYLPEDGEALRVYYFRGSRSRGHYDARGRAPYEGGWRKPVKDAPITSRFNPKRMHPVLKKVMPHNGTDFGAPTGTPVGASSPGVVSSVGYQGPSGNLVTIDHAGGYTTGYAHLSRFAEGLKVGDHVSRLQLVGYVGSTGRSTGPHLHFSAKKDGKFIDPESLQLDALRVLPKEERDEFAKTRKTYDELLEAIPLPRPPPRAVAEAAPQPPAEPPGDPGEDSDELEDDAPPAAPVIKAVAQAPKAPLTPKPTGGANRPIYLTDKQLLEMQGGSDDGEVEE